MVSSTDIIQRRLLLLATLFLGIYCVCLTLAPVVRARGGYYWEPWLAFLGWGVLIWVANRGIERWLPARDPFLLPIAALLSGWGLLTIWRLSPYFGRRQGLWLLLATTLLILGFRLPGNLTFLRRFKYLWLTAGLVLTGITLFLGTNPSGGGLPRLWLGCCGVYFQPSEPLKLLLIIYLAAYMADRLPITDRKMMPLLAPTLIMAGLALLLLIFQRDLGTALVFLFLYAAVVYVASGRKSILLAMGLTVLLAGVTGYSLFDVVRLRVDAWLNPWIDPSGRSYQIVQSLLAVASGGLLGRGPGMGSPNLVPVYHSDFIFTSIAEENGLVGTSGLIILLALFANRGIRTALYATDAYRRYLAAGLIAYLTGQSILIIGGNLRLLPLTGVTLPFLSYGGSSLMVSFLALLLLLHISSQVEVKPASLPDRRPYLLLNGFFLGGLAAITLVAGWWAVYRGPDLLTRTDNPRRSISDLYVYRGALLDRHNLPLVETVGKSGGYTRIVRVPELSPVVGYNDPAYGQSGLEASLDSYLRGLRGNSGLLIWWSHLLYGQPPPGLDIRLSLDVDLQRQADQLLGEHAGAVVLLEADNGDILVMASHPTFDANRLAQEWTDLISNPHTPLLNRATLGQYQPGPSLGPFMLVKLLSEGSLPALPQQLSYPLGNTALDCAFSPTALNWGAVISNGCPGSVIALGNALERQGISLVKFYTDLGLYTPPEIHLPVARSTPPKAIDDIPLFAVGQAELRVSPLQMALAVATLSNDGLRPAPRLETAVNVPQVGWTILPYLGESKQVFPEERVETTLESLAVEGLPAWQSLAIASNGPQHMLTWYLGGTLPGWNGNRFAVVILLEENDPELARQIGQALLKTVLK